MQVLHLHRIGGIGGSERHLLALLPALRARGIDARFLGLDDPARRPEPFYEQLTALGVPFTRLPCPRDLDPRLALATARSVRELRPAIVHTHLVHADVYGAFAARRSGATVVSTKHNDDPFRAGPFRFVERVTARRASRVICITGALARFNVDRVGIPAGKVRVVHYGLDRPPDPWGDAGGPELPEGARVLLAVSRLERQKGLDLAVQALAALRRDDDAVHLVVLGEGSLRGELEGLARELGVATAVHLPGRVGDVRTWLERAELLVHPARWEGFGLALLEAMLCSRPVVATRVSSIPEIVADGETGLLVEPDDPTALADAIRALLQDPGRARALGEAGLARARTAFSVERMVKRTLAVYDETLASASR
jgi:glycosyltransferase involved in cell wall biosynthesis